MDEFFVVRILERICYLFNVCYDGGKWNLCALWMTLSQVAIYAVTQDKVRGTVFNAKIKHRYNIWMLQGGNSTRLITEFFYISFDQLGVKHLNCYLSAEVYMFSQIDFGKSTFSE